MLKVEDIIHNDVKLLTIITKQELFTVFRKH